MGCVDVTVLLDERWDERLSTTRAQHPPLGADTRSPPMEHSSGWFVANRTY
jgi:hypothetical protein